MKPVVHVELTATAIKTVLAVLAVLAMGLGLVWLVFGLPYAIAGGIGVVVLVRGVYALFTPSGQ